MRRCCVDGALAVWALALLAALPGPAAADDVTLRETLVERAESCEVTVCVTGRYEFRYLRLSDFVVDRDGNRHGVQDIGRQLWRLRPRINIGEDLFIELEGDLVSGRIFGDTTLTARDQLLRPEDELDAWGAPGWGDFRAAYLSWQSPIGLFRIGHQTSHYGFGILANAGDDTDHDLFDSPMLGDIVDRVIFATKPLAFLDDAFSQSFFLAGGFDVIFRDENAFLMEGDLAMQGIVSLGWRADWLEAGVYMAFRRQEDADGDVLDVEAYDIFVRWTQDFARVRVMLGAEGVLVDGRTTRVIGEQAQGGVDVLGGGAVLQSRVTLLDLGLEFRFEAGFASGDNDLNDDTVRSFSFDPSYHVGMILFQEVMGRVTARTLELARDPSLQGEPRRGVDQIPSDGAITNAVYLNPVVRYRAPFGLTWALGVLAAWSPADVADAYASNLRGGYNTNYLGNPVGSSYLGTELDAGVGYEVTIRNALRVAVGLQGGVFIPGGAFDGPQGGATLDTVGKLRTTLDLGW